jgi:hypothetical protein
MMHPMRRALIIAIPFLLAVPVLYGLAFSLAGHGPMPAAFGIGAAGWLIAFLLRTPVGLIATRTGGSEDRAQSIVVLSSGPLEEGVRLVAVLLVGRDLATALWLGLGWASIEVLFAIVNGLALAGLSERTDPEAERVRALLPKTAFDSSAAAWGVVERAWASALHIGFTLVIAWAPIAVLLTAPVHSAVNIGFLRAAKRYPVAIVSISGAVVGAAFLAVGVLLHLA